MTSCKKIGVGGSAPYKKLEWGGRRGAEPPEYDMCKKRISPFFVFVILSFLIDFSDQHVKWNIISFGDSIHS